MVSTPLKNISQLVLCFPIYGKIKLMFQTTNQILIPSHMSIIFHKIFPPAKWRALGAALRARSVITLARPRCTTRGLDAGLCTTREAETTVRAGAETTCQEVVKIVPEITRLYGLIFAYVHIYILIFIYLFIPMCIYIYTYRERDVFFPEGLLYGLWCTSDKYMLMWPFDYHGATWCAYIYNII